MDGKTVAIGVLVVLAVLLGGLVTGGLRQPAAYAQGGVYATYLATAVGVRENLINFAVLDTESRRLVFYDVELPKFDLRPTDGRMLAQDFKHAP